MDRKVPQLDALEKATLQNIMLRMAYEREQIAHLKAQIALAETRQSAHHMSLANWNTQFNIKLRAVGLDISQVEIDAETGMVVALPPQDVKG